MAKKPTKTSPYKSLAPWTWPLPFDNETAINVFLDRFLGENVGGAKIKRKEQLRFMAAMRSSLSLNIREKRMVVQAYPTLSRFQFDALLETWEEERQKFTELANDHPEDIAKLMAKMEFEWALFLNPTHGTLSFFSRYLFESETALPTDALVSSFDLYSNTLSQEENYSDIVLLIQTILERGDKIDDRRKINVLNSGFYALVRSGIVSDEFELERHPFYQEMGSIALDDENMRRNKAFLEFCASSYLMDIRGIKDLRKSGEYLCSSYKKAGTRIPDLSSSLSTYFILCGEFSAALRAAEICLKKYSRRGSYALSNDHLLRVAERGGKEEVLGSNAIRNSVRYFVLLSCFEGFQHELKRRDFVKLFFQEPLTHFNSWRPDKHINHLSYFIVFYYFAQDRTLERSQGVQRHLDGSATESERFLYRLAFSRSLRGGELDGLKMAMKDIGSKSDLLTYALSVRAISTSRLQLASDKAFVCETVKKAYVETVREKGWFLNEEAAIFDLHHEDASP